MQFGSRLGAGGAQTSCAHCATAAKLALPLGRIGPRDCANDRAGAASLHARNVCSAYDGCRGALAGRDWDFRAYSGRACSSVLRILSFSRC